MLRLGLANIAADPYRIGGQRIINVRHKVTLVCGLW